MAVKHPPLRRVSTRNLCPVCGRDSFCSYNEYIVICTRVESDRPVKGKGTGWIHIPDDAVVRDYEPPADLPEQAVKQSVEGVSKVYTEMLSRLSLSADHIGNLQRRGMSGKEMQRHGYKSMPEHRRAFAKELLEAGFQLEGVPGFYKVDADTWTLGGAPGMLVPVKDVKGRVVGIQVRRDDPKAKPKYLWLSSAEKVMGCGSSSPIHVAIPETVTNPLVYITEGPLKANIAAERLEAYVLAVPGVDVWKPVFQVLPFFETTGFVIAYDADLKTNPYVRKALSRFLERMQEKGYPTFLAQWDLANGKGIDDLLVNGHRPNLSFLRG